MFVSASLTTVCWDGLSLEREEEREEEREGGGGQTRGGGEEGAEFT